MEHCGVIDRKELEEALAGRSSPVHHFLKIVEFTHSEIISTAECEYRDGGTRSLPVTAAETYLEVSLHHKGLLGRNLSEPSVFAVFPSYRSKCLFISYKKLILKHFCHVERKGPYREIDSLERNNLSPVLECLAAACDREHLIRAKGRSSYLKKDIGTFGSLLCLLCLAAEDSICKC